MGYGTGRSSGLFVDGKVITAKTCEVPLAPDFMGINNYTIEIETDIELLNKTADIVFRAKDNANFYMRQFTDNRVRPHVWSNGGVTLYENGAATGKWNWRKLLIPIPGSV